MADEQYRWLNGETAELLLRGKTVEAVESVDESARDQAERLAGALGALSVPSAAAEGELPGEAAAVAVFRKAAEARAADSAERSGTGSDPSGDVGLVRIGRPGRAADSRVRTRWRRPVRLGLAAALLLGSVGGAAALAATGVIPGPFDDSRPGPAATVPAAVTPDRTAGSAAPDTTATGGSGSPATGGTATGGSGGGTDRDGSSAGTGPGATGQPGGNTSGWKGVAGACRDLRDGKELGVGRKRALVEAAGGASRVWTYCRGVLQYAGSGAGSSNGQDNGDTNGKGNGKANGGGQGNDGSGGQGNDGGADGDGGGQGNQNGGGQGGDRNGNGGDDEGSIHKGHRVRHRDETAVTPSPAGFAPPASPDTRAPSDLDGTLLTALPSPDPACSAL